MPFSSAYAVDEADKEIKEKRILILNDAMTQAYQYKHQTTNSNIYNGKGAMSKINHHVVYLTKVVLKVNKTLTCYGLWRLRLDTWNLCNIEVCLINSRTKWEIPTKVNSHSLMAPWWTFSIAQWTSNTKHLQNLIGKRE